MLNWTQGEAITYTRLTTIPETLKVASLPSDYETFARGVKYDDNFIRELVNLGWPLRFAHSIDSSVLRFLQLERAYGKTGAGASRTGGSQEIIMFSGSVSRDIIPKSVLVDSCAQISCVRESAVDIMKDAKPSQICITSANTKTTECKWEGMVQINAVNSTGMPGVTKSTPFSFRAVTMEPLTKELQRSYSPLRTY